FKNYARVQLQSDEGKEIYGQRKIEVEPVFADVKAHLRFTRFSVRGLDKVNIEVGLVLMAMNMIKWAREKAHLIIEIRKKQGNEKIDQRKAKITFLWSIYFELCPKLIFIFSKPNIQLYLFSHIKHPRIFLLFVSFFLLSKRALTQG
ncbi:transposase, partial [Furfurilactobacillus rossiae]